MKNLVIPLFLLLSAGYAGAQNSSASHTTKQDAAVHLVPVKVHQKFLLENPGIKATWKSDRGVFTAQYINPVNNIGHMIVYDSLGHILRRERELENQDYPPQINDYFIKEYPEEGYAVWLSVDAAGNQTFYANHSRGIFRFDKHGNLVSPSKNKMKKRDSIR